MLRTIGLFTQSSLIISVLLSIPSTRICNIDFVISYFLVLYCLVAFFSFVVTPYRFLVSLASSQLYEPNASTLCQQKYVSTTIFQDVDPTAKHLTKLKSMND